MPILLIGTGLLLVLTGIKGDPVQLYGLVTGDFTGPNNFVYWLISILVLGSLGYIPSLKNLSRLFVALVVVVLLLDNRGFFAQLQQFINGGQTAAASSATSSTGGTQ